MMMGVWGMVDLTVGLADTCTSGALTNRHMRYRGGDPPIGETGGGKMGYGSYKTPRTQGSSGTPGHYYRRYGAAGGAAIEIEARNIHVDGSLTQMANMVITIPTLISEQGQAGAQAEVSYCASVENSQELASSQQMEVRGRTET